MEKFDLCVVIPCLNEEKTVAACLEKCKASFERLHISGEVIVVDNGSTDNTAVLSEQHGARVVFCPEKGYGNALRTGFKACNSRYVLMGDGDDTYDFLEIPLLWNLIATNADMIIGTRLKGYIKDGAMPWIHRYFGTPVLTFVLNLLYGTKVSDSQCGMRLMKKECLDKINFTATGMEFASELLVEFAKHKFRIVETPISLYKDQKGRLPHLQPWRDGLRHLVYLVRAKFKK